MGIEDQAQAIATRFAHEISGPVGSVGQALELMELQLQTILTQKDWKLWEAAFDANFGDSAPIKNKENFSGLPDRLWKRLHQAIAKNPKVEKLTVGMDEDHLDRALKIFEAGFSYKCARMGVESSQEIIKNLRSWGNFPKERFDQPVLVARTLQIAWALVSSRTKNLQISWKLEDTPAIIGNPYALTQVWMNLFLNASQVNQNGCRIDVTLKKKQKSMEILIANEGKTLPKGIRLFEKGHSQRDGGSGIGLHLCKEVVEAHKGKIVARNMENGDGVEILVELPL